jgi:hypothetical protein
MASRSQRDADDMMLVDEDFDADGDDQLIDDDDTQVALPTETASPSSFDAPPLPEQSHLNSRRRRPQEGSVGPQASIDKSVRKREQREREKEQQKQLLAKLIEIFGMHSLVSMPCPHCFRQHPANPLCRGWRWYMCSPAGTEEISLGRLTLRINTNRLLFCWLAREVPP